MALLNVPYYQTKQIHTEGGIGVEKTKGLLIVLSGPSGVGKGTVKKEFIDDPSLKLAYSVSMTTRKSRPGEMDGKDYFFVSVEEFQKKIEEGELLEYTQFVGNYYGTPLSEVNRLRDEGYNVLLEIEVDGCQQVMKKVPDAISIFIVPPSMEELERRIRKRGTESEDVVMQRLEKAEREMAMTPSYKYVVCNDDPRLAADIIKIILKRHMQKQENA